MTPCSGEYLTPPHQLFTRSAMNFLLIENADWIKTMRFTGMN